MKEIEIKQKMQQILSEELKIDKNKICITKNDADIVIQCGDISNWLYFELKTCSLNENIKPHWGAVYKSQWKKSKQTKNYYFVLVKTKGTKIINYLIVSPDVLQSYISGYNTFTYISIPDKINWQNHNQFIKQMKDIRDGKDFVNELSEKELRKDKKTKIKAMIDFITQKEEF